jgi:hypothetical protein
MLKCITNLHRKITADIVVCWTLLVLAGWFIDREDLGAGGGDDVLVLDTGLLERHLGNGTHRNEGQGGVEVMRRRRGGEEKVVLHPPTAPA